MHCASWRLVAALALTATAACRPEFELKNLTTNEALYGASLSEYKRGHWDNAVSGFEKLTTDLPARDSLLPRSYWYLASSHDHLDEHLLAAQSYGRLYESFPEDSLADDAALEAARSYRKLWRKPQLDPQYGQTSLASYNTLIGLYPDSPLIPAAKREIDTLQNWFAIKDYDAGLYYIGRKCYDCGMIYFKDVISKYATTPTARLAAVRLVSAYKSVHYLDDASELCAQVKQRYPNDPETRDVCRGVPAWTKGDTATASTPALPPPKPPAY